MVPKKRLIDGVFQIAETAGSSDEIFRRLTQIEEQIPQLQGELLEAILNDKNFKKIITESVRENLSQVSQLQEDFAAELASQKTRIRVLRKRVKELERSLEIIEEECGLQESDKEVRDSNVN